MKRIDKWQWRSLAFAAAAAAGLLTACTAPETRLRAGAQGGQMSAADMVEEAARALGSERARIAALALRAEQSGPYYAGEQARSPAEPIGQAGRVYRWSFDAGRQRAIREAEQLFPGQIRFHYRAAITPEGAWNVDMLKWRNGGDLQTFGAAEALRNRLQYERFFPHILVHQSSTSGALETSGPRQWRYRDAAGTLVEVDVDPATSRPARAAEIVEGKRQLEWVYSDYERRHGVMMPRRVQVFQSGRLQEDLTLGATRIARIAEAELAAPAGYSPPPAQGQPLAREIAPGVLFFDDLQADYHSMAVDMGDHLLLVEAPLNPAYAETQQRLLAERYPGKAVRYVLVTHHHGDHNGGLIKWAEAGATIVVPTGAKVAIERQLKARGFTGTARIEEVDSRRSFGSGAMRVDAHVFSSSHAEAHMIVHVPQRRVLFQGDLFYLPERGGVPRAFEVVGELRRQIERLGLEVDVIAGVHGRPGTMADLRESLRLADAD